MKYFLSSCFLFMMLLSAGCGSSGSSSQLLEPVSMARPPRPEVTMLHRFYARGDSLYLFLRFEDVRQVLAVSQTATSLRYSVRAGAAERDAVLASDSVSLATAGRVDGQGMLVPIRLPLQQVQAPNVLHLQLRQTLNAGEHLVTKYRLPLLAAMGEKHFLVMHPAPDRPLLQDYTTTATPLLLQAYSGDADTLELQRFEADFTPALPPMSTRPETVPRTISVAETRMVAAGDTFYLQTPGLYLLAPGSKFAAGILAQPNAFPLVTMASELVAPLIYLTTTAERQALLQDTDPKAAVDRFWLKLAGDKSKARELIRTYYSRVETANKLYTSHKAGWATDRGMIYIIFGRPSDISHVGNTESWIYRDSETSPYVKFVFTKKENNFTGNHYELIRRPEYEESWYSTVAKWRAGITRM